MNEIRNHEWFTKNLPGDLVNENVVDQFRGTDQPTQSVDEIIQMMPWMRTWRVI
ncbi:putative non-specific serine/threonine protein kinase [Helianthus anomalus]